MRLVIFLLTVLTAVLPAGNAPASDGDRVAWNRDVVIPASEVVRGDVVVVGGSALVEGAVLGDVLVTNGNIILGVSARVGGDTVVTGGKLRVPASGEVLGDRVEIVSLGVAADSLKGQFLGQPLSGASTSGPTVSLHTDRSLSSPMAGQPTWLRITTALLASLVLLVLGQLLMWVAPQRSENLRRTIESAPRTSLAMGGLASLGFLLMATLLFVTVVGWTALPFLGLLAGALYIFGLTGFLEMLGDRMPLPRSSRTRSADLVWGAILFAALASLCSLGGFVGSAAGLILILMGCTGLGAAFLSLGGKRTYSTV